MIPKLLLNENFPAPATAVLRVNGIDVLAIGETNPGVTDQAVMALAVQTQRWIVTFDRDYGELVFGRKLAAPPAIILLRERHYRPEEPADWIMELLRKPEQFAGQFVLFSRQAIRMRSFG